MTVCTASTFYWFYGDNDAAVAIVTASDRMLTDNGLGIEYQGSHSKIAHFGPHHMIMVSGDLSVNSFVLQALKEAFPEKPPSTAELAIGLGNVICAVVADRAARKYLRPLGITTELIQQTQGGLSGLGLPLGLLEQIAGQMQSETLDVEAIVLGCDGRIASMFRVDGGGIVTSHADIGFLSIGSGGVHSSAYFMQLPFNHQVGYHHALRTTFFAKKRAEVSPGVGVQTDMFLITGNGISAIQDADLTLMEQGYRQHRKQSDRWLDRFTKKLATRGQEADAVKRSSETPLSNGDASEDTAYRLTAPHRRTNSPEPRNGKRQQSSATDHQLEPLIAISPRSAQIFLYITASYKGG